MWDGHHPAQYRCAEADDHEVCGRPQHLCGIPGGRPKVRFGARVVVVGAEDALRQRLMQLDLAIEPFCSSLEPFELRGTHCRGAVETIGLSGMW